MATRRFWQVNDEKDQLAQSVQARINVVEALRAQYHREQPEAEMQIQRVCRIVSLEEFNQSKQS